MIRVIPTLFDRYVMKILGMATCVTALSLTLIILLTQSIRYLELVISSDASPTYFLIMIAYAIPKFLEAILPLAFAIGSVYTAHRMMADREMIIMAAAGNAVPSLGRGFIAFAFIMMFFQFLLSGWISPLSVSKLQQTRESVKSHYATLMFQEGVFNSLSNGLTAFVEQRAGMNELRNLMIHDENATLNTGKKTTILAKRGIVNLDPQTQQLLIYNGTQYEEDIQTGQIARLDFDQYTLDIPVDNPAIANRWKEPDERTLDQLFVSEASASATDLKKRNEFIAEINKRLSTPFLYASFILLILVFMFLGSWNRRKQSSPLIKSAIAVIAIQALYIVFYNEARDVIWMNAGLYAVVIAPIIYGISRLTYHSRIK